MKGWILVAPSGVASDRSLQGWIDKSVAFACTGGAITESGHLVAN